MQQELIMKWLMAIICAACAAGLVSGAPNGEQAATDADDHDEAGQHVVAFEKNALGFEKLEMLLQKKVNHERPGDNLKAAIRLLEGERAKPAGERDAHLLAALEQFAALAWIESDLARIGDRSNGAELLRLNTCNRISFAALDGLNVATHRRAYRKRGPLRRIELVLAHFAWLHAVRCKLVYPVRFGQLLEEFPSERVEQIDAIMRPMLDARVKEGRAFDPLGPIRKKATSMMGVIRATLLSFMQHNDTFKTRRDAVILAGLMRSSDDFNRELSQMNQEADRFKRAVRQWMAVRLLEPCAEYTKHFGPDVFEPAQNDVAILNRASRFKPGVVESEDEFIDGWVRYGFCFMLRRDQNILTKKIISLM